MPSAPSDFQLFCDCHKQELETIPTSLWRRLYEKLVNETFDAGSHVILHNENNKLSLHVKDNVSLQPQQDIFLVDHAWTTTPTRMESDLTNIPGLLERVENILGLSIESQEEEEEEEDRDKEREGNGEGNVEGPSTIPEELKESVDLLMAQTNVTEEKAYKALIDNNNEIVNALMALTDSEEEEEDEGTRTSQPLSSLMQSIEGSIPNQDKAPSKSDRVKAVLTNLWKGLMSYEVALIQTDGTYIRNSVLYLPDEVGSAIQHSDTPNVNFQAFVFKSTLSEEIAAYSIFWPVAPIENDQAITRHFKPIERSYAQ